MSSKQICKTILSIGSLQIIWKTLAIDQQANKQPNVNKFQTTDINVFRRSQVNKYRNPRVTFNYFSPPGDLIAHPELIYVVKNKDYSLQKDKSQQFFDLRGKSLASSVYITNKKVDQQQSKYLFKQYKVNHALNSSRAPTPKKKISNLSFYSKSTSKKNLIVNPEDFGYNIQEKKLQRNLNDLISKKLRFSLQQN